jgi:hypothetical protein
MLSPAKFRQSSGLMSREEHFMQAPAVSKRDREMNPQIFFGNVKRLSEEAFGIVDYLFKAVGSLSSPTGSR